MRAWVDLDPEGDLQSEIELPLHQQADWRWVGVMGFAESCSEHFFYRLGIVAQAGAEWSFKVRDRTAGRDILCDTDMLTSAKCWLIGSCALRASGAERGGRLAQAYLGDEWSSSRRHGEGNVVYLARRRPK